LNKLPIYLLNYIDLLILIFFNDGQMKHLYVHTCKNENGEMAGFVGERHVFIY